MTRPVFRPYNLPTNLDGFHVELIANGLRADIILDRPPMNAMSLIQHEQMKTVIESLDVDPTVQVIVIRGSGEHFSNGIHKIESDDGSAFNASKLAFALSAPSRCSKPVIAANRGYCFGSAFELSLACDFRIVTETTAYSLPAHRPGQVPGFDSVTRLSGMIGTARTRDILMRSQIIDGAKAYDWGVATEFSVDGELENATEALVRELLALSPFGPQATKRLLSGTGDTSLRPDMTVAANIREAISA